jgi:3-oxoacyl-[acyl-carrier protein] reductase
MENMNSSELINDVAIVTGSGVNTGSVIARRLAAAGAAVVVNYRRAEEGANDTVEKIRSAGGRAIAVRADVTIQDEVNSMVAQAIETFGLPSILINNANVRSFRSILEITAEEWRQTLGPTLDGTFFSVQACVPHMRNRGRGTIVNIGGGSGHSGRPKRCHVAAAKAGLAGMTGSLASELAPDNITVNCIVPGKIDIRPPVTNRSKLVSHTPLGRAGEMDEIAALVEFLCTSKCRYMTGQMLHVNGGAYVTIA